MNNILSNLYGAAIVSPKIIGDEAISAVNATKNFVSDVSDFAERRGGWREMLHDVAANIGNAANSLLAEPTISGSTGSTAGFKLAVRINAHFTEIVEGSPEYNGYPLCKNMILSDLKGFCKVLNGDVEISGTKSESEALKAFLEGGIYIE